MTWPVTLMWVGLCWTLAIIVLVIPIAPRDQKPQHSWPPDDDPDGDPRPADEHVRVIAERIYDGQARGVIVTEDDYEPCSRASPAFRGAIDDLTAADPPGQERGRRLVWNEPSNFSVIGSPIDAPIPFYDRLADDRLRRAKAGIMAGTPMLHRIEALLEERGEKDTQVTILHTGQGKYRAIIRRGRRRGSAFVSDDMGHNQFVEVIIGATEKLRPPLVGSFLGAAGGSEDIFEQRPLSDKGEDGGEG